MIQDRLKEATREVHLALEKQLIPHMKEMSQPADYSRMLALFYGFFQPVEQLANPFLDAAILPDAAARRKSGDILEDIQVLTGGMAVEELCTDLPQIDNSRQAMGALYVLEGSTLGGQVICQMIRKRLGDQAPVHFFDGYGDQTAVMWERFKNALEKEATDEAAGEQILAAATDTFVKFGNWIEKQTYGSK